MGSRATKSRKTSRSESRHIRLKRLICSLFAFVLLSCVLVAAQETRNLTPVQLEIQTQQRRLSSSDVEERRDAVMHLGAMRLAAASRAAVPAVQDAEAIVRGAAAQAVFLILRVE